MSEASDTSETTTHERPARWAVVGGGMLGATAARKLAESGAQVVLYESAPQLGGLASGWQLPVPGGEPVTWDRFYHVVLGTDRRVLRMLDELGITDVAWGTTKASCFAGGQVHPASSAAELVGLPFLGPVAKLRIALTVLWGAVWSSGRIFDRVTAARWLRRWSGRQATERLWLPLLRAKLGHTAESASATFIWASIRRLVTARLQGRDADRFGHVPGGYAIVLGAQAQQLASRGVDVRTGSRVHTVRSGGSEGSAADNELLVEVDGVDGPVVESFDRVLVTLAAPLAARLCPELTAAEQDRLTSVEYLGVICPSVLLRRGVTGSYITYITDPKPFTAVIEMTALVDPAELGGHTLVYLPRYTSPEDPAFDLPDEALRRQFLDAFLQMYDLTEADVLSFSVARARMVVPVPTPGYRHRVPQTQTSVPGLYTVGSAQIIDGTLNIEETLKLLEDAWPDLDTGPVRTAAPLPVVPR